MSVIGNTALQFSEEQAMLLDVAGEFCRDKSPIAAVRAQLETERGYDQATWDEMVGLGWTGIALPESCGGSGLGVAAVVPVVEAMGRAMLGTPFISTTLAGQLLLRAGSTEQVERLLPGIATGVPATGMPATGVPATGVPATGVPATVALLENEDWGDERPRCSVDADGVMQGSKRYVADAAVAGWFLVPVTHRGEVVLAVVEAAKLSRDALTPHTLIDQTRRAATVDFSGVQLGDGDLITGERVTAALRDTRLLGALLVAADATGAAAACLDTVVDYLKTRRQFGRLIGSYQALKHPAVDILLSIDSARSFVYHAATLVGQEALDTDAEIACRMAKADATRTLLYAGDRAVQFHGGMGFTYECDAQLYIRRAQWSQQQFGDAQHHRKHLAALLLD